MTDVRSNLKYNLNSDVLQIAPYENTQLLTALLTSKDQYNRPTKATWITPNLLLLNPAASECRLFNIDTLQECKDAGEQTKSNNKELSKFIVTRFKEEAMLDENNPELIAMMATDLFKSDYRFTTGKYQFASITSSTIVLWNTENPSDLKIDNIVKPLPSKIQEKCNVYTRYGYDEPGHFRSAFFPDRRWIVSLVEKEDFHFKNVDTGESFSLKEPKTPFFHDLKILNNQQILLTSFEHGKELEATTYLMTVDLPNKIAKLHLDKPFTKSDWPILPLASQLIVKIDEEYNFSCWEVSPDGTAFKRLDELIGNATIYAQLETNEILYWDKNTKYLTLLDPFARRMIRIQEMPEVNQILICGRELLVVSPDKLWRCFIPNYAERVANHLTQFFQPPLNRIVLSYLGMSSEGHSCLLAEGAGSGNESLGDIAGQNCQRP